MQTKEWQECQECKTVKELLDWAIRGNKVRFLKMQAQLIRLDKIIKELRRHSVPITVQELFPGLLRSVPTTSLVDIYREDAYLNSQDRMSRARIQTIYSRTSAMFEVGALKCEFSGGSRLNTVYVNPLWLEARLPGTTIPQSFLDWQYDCPATVGQPQLKETPKPDAKPVQPVQPTQPILSSSQLQSVILSGRVEIGELVIQVDDMPLDKLVKVVEVLLPAVEEKEEEVKQYPDYSLSIPKTNDEIAVEKSPIDGTLKLESVTYEPKIVEDKQQSPIAEETIQPNQTEFKPF